MATQRLNIPPARICPRGKRRYYSEAVAQADAAEVARNDRVNRPTAGPVAVYHCRECQAWHVGHVY